MSRNHAFAPNLLPISLLLCFLTVPSEAGPLEARSIRTLDAAPVVDGKADPVWYGQPVLVKHDPDGLIPYAIRITAGLYQRNLYVAAAVSAPTGERISEGDRPAVLHVFVDPSIDGDRVFEFSLDETGVRDDVFRGDFTWTCDWEGASAATGGERVLLYEMGIPLAALGSETDLHLPFLAVTFRMTFGKDTRRFAGWGILPTSTDTSSLDTYLVSSDLAAFVVRSLDSFLQRADRERTDMVGSGIRVLEDAQIKQTADLSYRIQRLRQKVQSAGDRTPTEWLRWWRQTRDLESEWDNLAESLRSFILAEQSRSGKDTRGGPQGKRRPSEEFDSSIVPAPIRWCRPYAEGTIRALVLVPYKAAWEVDELRIRADLDVETVLLDSPTRFSPSGWADHRPGDAPRRDDLERRITELLEQQDWDVILIGNFAWDQFPPRVRYRILEEVAAGTGLAGLGLAVKGEDFVAANLKGDRAGASKFISTRGSGPLLQELGPNLETMQFGAGRILRLYPGPQSDTVAFTPNIRLREGPTWAAEYEGAISSACRAVIWASGYTPKNRLVSSSGWENAGEPVEIRFSDPVDKKNSIEWRVRSGVEIVKTRGPRDLEDKTTRYTLPSPELPPGSYYADVFLLEKGRVADWMTVPFSVKAR